MGSRERVEGSFGGRKGAKMHCATVKRKTSDRTLRLKFAPAKLLFDIIHSLNARSRPLYVNSKRA